MDLGSQLLAETAQRRGCGLAASEVESVELAATSCRLEFAASRCRLESHSPSETGFSVPIPMPENSHRWPAVLAVGYECRRSRAPATEVPNVITLNAVPLMIFLGPLSPCYS